MPIISVEAKGRVGTNEIYLDPTLSELKEIVKSAFHKMIAVNKDILRIENIMFPGKWNLSM